MKKKSLAHIAEKKSLPYRAYAHIYYCRECGAIKIREISKSEPYIITHYTCPCRGFQMHRVIIDTYFFESLHKEK